MEKVKLVLGLLGGIVLSFLIRQVFPKEMKEKEKIVFTNSRDVYILDSLEFANNADSVIIYGNENSYMKLDCHYSNLVNGLSDFFYYAFVVANKYSYNYASDHLFFIMNNTVNDNKNNHSMLTDMMRYYLLFGADKGNLYSCMSLVECYEKGILFEKNPRKADFYKNKIKKIKEIKWKK